MGGDEEFYINYFQEPGRAEAEAELDVGAWLLGFYIGASGDAIPPADGGTIGTVRRGGMLRDRFVIPDELPAWLSDEDLEFYIAEFERTGFRGALNRYRNVDRDWLELQPWSRQPITVPSFFIGGERDGPDHLGPAGHRPVSPDPARAARQPHPARLRSLGPAGTRPGGQRTPRRLAEGL